MRLHQLTFTTWALVLSILLSVSVAAAPAEQAPAKPKAKKPKKPPAPPIGKQLTLQDFDATIRKGYWFVEFYSPSCPHCKKFAPTWKQFVESDIKNTPGLQLAQVNCLVQGDLCGNLEVKGYPELNFFYEGKRIGQFDDDRLLAKLSSWVTTNIKNNDAKVLAAAAPAVPKPPAPAPPPAAPVDGAAQRPPFKPAGKPANQKPAVPAPPPADPAVKQKALADAQEDLSKSVTPAYVPNPEGQVISLNLANMQSVMAEGPVFVKFFAPWCGHCKKLAPIWAQIAQYMKGKLTIAEVDCEANKPICQKYKIDGYPQMFLFSNGKRVEYIGKRAFEQIAAYANKAIMPAAVPIALPAFEEVLKTQDVFYLLDYPAGATEIAHIVEEAAKVLVGNPSVYRSTDEHITKKYGTIEPPVLMVFKDGKLRDSMRMNVASPPAMDDVSDWMLANRLPIALELGPENFADVMKSPAHPLVVLSAVDTNAPTFAAQREIIFDAARRWREKATELRAQRVSYGYREVVFVWMDGVEWASWLKSMYGIKSGLPKIVIVDHSASRHSFAECLHKLIYADTDAGGRPVEMHALDIADAVNDALRDAIKWRHSENFAERGVRYLGDSVESGYAVVQSNWTSSLFALGVFFVLVYAALRRCLREDRSVYVPAHLNHRLD
ncbi:thioredoxin-domain-containing protein [Auriculariales sp. MPI-PUGE-AT-0066]|nr:thioredoxin-domain-containing protein [Auriculariales sp. MPI-PUGE-AT-0066]